MKQWVSMLLILCLTIGLAACGITVEEPVEEQKTMVQEEREPAALERAEYSIETKDHSIRDDQGNICVEQYYDLVVLSGEGPVVEAINQDLQARYDNYVNELPTDPAEIQSYIDMCATNGGYTFFNNIIAEETYNDNGFLSLRYTKNWFMGGTMSSFYTANVYNLETGNTVTAAETLGVDSDVLTYYLKDTIRKYIFENYWEINFFDEAEQIIANDYTIDDLQYYIGEGSQLYLCSYDLAPCSEGCLIIPCGIYLDDSQERQVNDYVAELTSIPVWSSYLKAENLFGKYQFASDGTCEILVSYYESDVGVAWTGTWSVNDSGLLILELADTVDLSYTVHWEYQLVPMGQALMLVQKSDRGPLNETAPGYSITMFPENVV